MNATLRGELARALRSHKYELTDDSRIYMPEAQMFVGGVFATDVNGKDKHIRPNLFVSEGLLYVLATAFAQGAAATGLYLAPFSGNVAPDATLNAANFTVRQTEFTGYNEATRVAWAGVVGSTPEIDNTASVATFTNNIANSTVWGFGLLTNAVKSATTGKLMAAFLDSVPRANLQVGDKLNVQYTISATSS